MVKVLAEEYSVDLIHSGLGYRMSDLGAFFGLDLSNATERIVRDSGRSFAVPGQQSLGSYLRRGLRFDGSLTAPYDLFVYSGHGVPPVSSARAAILYCHFPIEARPAVELSTTPAWQRRSGIDRRVRMAAYEYLWRHRMRGYLRLLANSRFTASWIQRLWGASAQVVYPPVSMEAPNGPKRNVIASIGRFDPRDRKNVAAQLDALPQFLSKVSSGWSLCLMGFSGEGPDDRSYLALLRARVQGLPVELVVNADREAVQRRLGEAKLFWHSRGLSRSDEGTLPAWRMEHFGIATVEAMMAGCVPLVPADGGQPEIVQDGINGFLCRDAQTLVQHSVELANDDDRRARMSALAVERSMAFRSEVFERTFRQAVRESLLTAGRVPAA
jgi:glycosyltransferase involved in cell wall biosynthesis